MNKWICTLYEQHFTVQWHLDWPKKHRYSRLILPSSTSKIHVKDVFGIVLRSRNHLQIFGKVNFWKSFYNILDSMINNHRHYSRSEQFLFHFSTTLMSHILLACRSDFQPSEVTILMSVTTAQVFHKLQNSKSWQRTYTHTHIQPHSNTGILQ